MDKIIDHLKDEQLISEDKDKNHLSILIAKLRDEGVIIAGSRDGYKIPESEKSYVNTVIVYI